MGTDNGQRGTGTARGIRAKKEGKYPVYVFVIFDLARRFLKAYGKAGLGTARCNGCQLQDAGCSSVWRGRGKTDKHLKHAALTRRIESCSILNLRMGKGATAKRVKRQTRRQLKKNYASRPFITTVIPPVYDQDIPEWWTLPFDRPQSLCALEPWELN